VSAYPQAVTGQMLLNFARGGAAINALARQAGARVEVVDMGVKYPPAQASGVRRHAIAPGTRNFAHTPAMTREQAVQAIEIGIGIASELAEGGVGALGLGEMGIGNTTSASALTAAFTGVASHELVGRGTGIDDAGVARKAELVGRALALHRPNPDDPLDVLAKLGGFEIAGLCGVMIGGAAAQLPVVLDGFIASAAALVAARLCPRVVGYAIASHRSAEPGHRIVLQALGAQPLFDLGLRLGEGTGAALAMHLLDAALLILHEMATFESAGVADAGA
jgi:nicotinate-nucleotide--dimethylbenzimidazole phosphoribosyltransferase